MITDIQLKELIDYLRGSCKSLDGGVRELFDIDGDDLTEEQLQEIDNEIFHCSQCGWWYEIAEESGKDDSDLICNDCADE